MRKTSWDGHKTSGQTGISGVLGSRSGILGGAVAALLLLLVGASCARRDLPSPQPSPGGARSDGASIHDPRDAASGGLAVHVVDSNGPIPGATVTIRHDSGRFETSAILSDRNGLAEFPTLSPGSGYVLDVRFPGFGVRRIPDVRVKSGESTPITVQLAAEIVERVRVAAKPKSRSKVDIEGKSPPAIFSQEAVQNLKAPGRFNQNLQVLPGSGDFDLKALGYIDMTPGQHNTESYDAFDESPFLPVVSNPLSTFAADVDTASYANVRRILDRGNRPPRGAVRIEELINYFPYDYDGPAGDAPFGVNVEISDAPWNAEHRLARIGLKTEEIDAGDRPPCNLVFLLDVSGSMSPPNKLPLLKAAMGLLTETLNGRDRVAIVVYAGAAGLVLPSTHADDPAVIRDSLARLGAGGSTAGGEGIALAYETARANFVPGGINRVILATDGDFNVGVTNQSELVRMIEREAATGVFLTVLGFGEGNFKDSTLEKLADRGNGNYAYIDSAREARKVLVEQVGSTLVTVAKDVKFQIEFNPSRVSAYRLLGYENRMLADVDFNDDAKDAGEIGAGHTVTALYELVPAGSAPATPAVDDLKYRKAPEPSEAAGSGELFTLKLRYKKPDGNRSRLVTVPVRDGGADLGSASDDFRFAAAVAGFGMVLRESEHRGDFSLEDVAALAGESLGRDDGGHRARFLDLVEQAGRVVGETAYLAPR